MDSKNTNSLKRLRFYTFAGDTIGPKIVKIFEIYGSVDLLETFTPPGQSNYICARYILSVSLAEQRFIFYFFHLSYSTTIRYPSKLCDANVVRFLFYFTAVARTSKLCSRINRPNYKQNDDDDDDES